MFYILIKFKNLVVLFCFCYDDERYFLWVGLYYIDMVWVYKYIYFNGVFFGKFDVYLYLNICKRDGFLLFNENSFIFFIFVIVICLILNVVNKVFLVD